MKRQAVIDSVHGGRSVHFETPCGIEVVLNRYPNGDFKAKFWFNMQPFLFGDGCPYAFSADGARMMAAELGLLYAGSDEHFKGGVEL